MQSGPTIAVRELVHRYGDRIALDRVTFEVAPGAIFGLLGPNGGGKTTLFRILTTLLRPSSGSATIGGADVVGQADGVRRQIGIVFQKPSLDGKLTVRENLMHQGHLYGLHGGGLRERIAECMARFGVADRGNDRAETLSGGLQRRVELAKSVLHRPKVLILDEPSTGLDPGMRLSLMEHLIELREREGVTSVLTTHLMDEAGACDRVAVLDRGRLLATDEPRRLKESIGGDVISVTASDVKGLGERVQGRFGLSCEVLGGQLRIERDRGHEFVPALIEAFPGEIESVTVGKPTLDDVFVHLTGHRLDADDASASGTERMGRGEGVRG